jgi:regulator of PEP synthase PpsR (kinase-PPPase family)
MTGMTRFHVHLVSDSTGETVSTISRACLVQFEGVDVIEHLWPMVRTAGQLSKVLDGVRAEPGLVIFTLVEEDLRVELQDACRALSVPCLSVLEPFTAAFAAYLGVASKTPRRPGRQHVMDAEYFKRIEAMNFVMAHDDGQAPEGLEEADVILLGVSRTSKTPTCVYLGNRGVKAANVPLVPGAPLPEVLERTVALVVGLTEDPTRLVQIRRNRLRMMKEERDSAYTDFERIKEEVAAARRLFNDRGWPVIDVTRRSIEETAAAILQLFYQRQRDQAGSGGT